MSRNFAVFCWDAAVLFGYYQAVFVQHRSVYPWTLLLVILGSTAYDKCKCSRRKA